MVPPIITFLLVLSLVVLIHELGHFLAAKMFGVKVHEFGFGYPPRMIGIYKNLKNRWKIVQNQDVDDKAKGTVYSINWLPFGGFVRMFGEFENDAMGSKSDQAFFNKKKRQRAIIILAGVFMNIVLAVVLFSTIYSISGIPEEVDYITVGAVAPGSPADTAGFEMGDVVKGIDGVMLSETSDFVENVQDKGGQEVSVLVERDGRELDLLVTPRENPPANEGAVGVIISKYDNVFYPAWEMPFRGAWVGIQEAYGWTRMMIEGIGTMIGMLFAGDRPEVTGPVGIYEITSNVAQQGIFPLMKFVGILSINLAVVNALPFPALDGGRFVFIMLEGVIGRKVKPKIEAYINMAGMLFLIGLMVLVTIGDVMRLMGR